jgi:glycine/D-amino acid oxidase-like deaminating enzyme/nitrite reductase/ring-hydroxylating ferredoxin subunit
MPIQHLVASRFRIMEKRSVWLDTSALPEFPKLEGKVAVDVVVVGGGITGLTTAYLLKETGCRVAGHLAMKQIEDIAPELQIDCELKRVPGYLFAGFGKDTKMERETLQRDADLASQFGFDADLTESDPVFHRPAVRFPNQLKFHPLKYVNALAKALPGGGCHVFSRTSGSDIDSEKRELHTDTGVISYQALVAATHVPIQGERGTFGAALFQTKLAAYSTYAIEAEIEPVAESLFWDTNDPYLYLRFDRRGNACSLIIGGEDHKTGHTEARYERLEKILKENFRSAKPRHRWSGQVIETPDGLPYIGEVSDRQFVATGFSGNGMTLGTFSAMLIRDLISGKSDPWNGLFSPNRKATVGTWDYVLENKDFPAYFIKDWIGSPVPAEDVRPGSGQITKIDGKKHAVYCDEQGKRTELSPICPHMGCIVAWNEAEKTWDCPCHGSRFTAMGEVIAGPAESNLRRIS